MNEKKALKDQVVKLENIRDYLQVIFRHKAVIVSTVIVVMISLYVSLSLYTPLNEATVKMMIEGRSTTEAEYYDRYTFPSRTLIEGEIIKSDHVVKRVVEALRLYNIPLDYEKNFSSRLKAVLISYRAKKYKKKLDALPAEQKKSQLIYDAKRRLKGNISVLQIKDSGMFKLSVRDISPTGAVLTANSISRSYVIFDLERQLVEIQLKYGDKHAIIKQLQDKIQDLYNYLDGKPIPAIEAIGPARVKIIEQAKEATLTVRYNKKLLLSLGFIVSVVIGILFSFGIEYLDQTIRSPHDVEKFLNIPFLGAIPKATIENKLLINNYDINSHYVHKYQNLADQFELLMKGKGIKSILVVDLDSSADTANVIANISICVTRKDINNQVIVIDANLRDSYLSKICNLNGILGLSEVLEGKSNFEDVIQHINHNLSVVAAGRTELNPTTLLGSSKMSDIISLAKAKYEVVFLAGANLKDFADSIIVSSFTDSLLLVVNAGGVRRQVAQHTIARLEQNKTKFLGAFINNLEMVIPNFIYDRL